MFEWRAELERCRGGGGGGGGGGANVPTDESAAELSKYGGESAPDELSLSQVGSAVSRTSSSTSAAPPFLFPLIGDENEARAEVRSGRGKGAGCRRARWCVEGV